MKSDANEFGTEFTTPTGSGMDIRLLRLRAIDPEVLRLVSIAESEGHANMALFVQEYESGRNCFAKAGEILLGAFDRQRLVGIGGLNADPYEPARGVGRVRRMYVDPAYRSLGVGAMLVGCIESHARGHFPALQLFTSSPRAAAFYEKLGYIPQYRHKVSHSKVLGAC